MNISEAANILRGMYLGAPQGEKVAQIHLFGIKYARELESMSLSDILVGAGLPESYETEVSKGRKLAKYVTLKE